MFQHSGDRIPHDEIIGKPDGTTMEFSSNKVMIAIHPTLAEYSLKMPRGAQVIYPKDLAIIPMWADVYPGARVFESGVGSGALTMALLRAVGDRGSVVSYEMREDFAATWRQKTLSDLWERCRIISSTFAMPMLECRDWSRRFSLAV